MVCGLWIWSSPKEYEPWITFIGSVIGLVTVIQRMKPKQPLPKIAFSVEDSTENRVIADKINEVKVNWQP